MYKLGGQVLAMEMLVEAVRAFVRNVRVLLTIRGHSRPHESDCTAMRLLTEAMIVLVKARESKQNLLVLLLSCKV
jgi:hypothetical protein